MKASEVLASCAIGVSDYDDTSSGWGVGLIIGYVLLAVVVLAVVIAFVMLVVKRRRRRTPPARPTPPTHAP